MKVKIGDKEQIFSTVLHVFDGEDAWVEFKHTNMEVKVNLKFVEDSEKKENEVVSVGKKDHASMTIYNWKHVMPSVLASAILIAESGGKKIFAMMSGYKVVGVSVVNISFLVGE